MKKNIITFHQQIWISRPRVEVWDYTQNYDYRPHWDEAVLSTEILQTTPARIVRLKLKGNTTMTFVYKLDDRPNKTTLATMDINSPVILSAGGYWVYEDDNNGTRWTQTNTIVLRNNLILSFLSPVFHWIFTMQTKKAMQRAKEILERS